MELREEKVYLFRFQTDAGDIQFPIRAQSKEEAADMIQKMLSRIQTEVAMEFPKVIPTSNTTLNLEDRGVKVFSTNPVPPEVLELKMDTLLSDMGAAGLKDKPKAETVKLWTGFDLKEENYVKIITELELLKTGQKEVPTKNGK